MLISRPAYNTCPPENTNQIFVARCDGPYTDKLTLQETGTVTASLIAQSVKEVVTVHKMDFGVPEAMWVIRVEDFPVVVTMDSHNQSIHEQVEARSSEKLAELIAP